MFDFATSDRIIFGSGAIHSLGKFVNQLGSHALVVKGKKYPDAEVLFKILRKEAIKNTTFIVPKEPDNVIIEAAIKTGRNHNCDFVIGFGGGAVIDAGKAVAAMLNNAGDLMDYLEVVGKGYPLKSPSLPYIAIPTTAGTGSEVTRNAVILIPEHDVKVSMRNKYLLPRVAIVDPVLTETVPPSITASTGMDAFTQVIEPYVTKVTNPLVDMFCREAIPIAAKNLLKSYSNGSNKPARTNMAYVSLLGGLSLANAKLGAVHGFAGPIGGMFKAPHGMVCAALLPAVMKINAEILAASNSNQEKINRFVQIAGWVTGMKNATITEGVAWIEELALALNIPGLSEYGISNTDFPGIIEKSKRSSSMKGNPVTLSDEQMTRILSMAL